MNSSHISALLSAKATQILQLNLKYSCFFLLFSLPPYLNEYKWQFFKNTEECISFYIEHDQMCLF